jgi:hypothetical protein
VRDNCTWAGILKSGEFEEDPEELDGEGDGNRVTKFARYPLLSRTSSSIPSSSIEAGGVRPVGW